MISDLLHALRTLGKSRAFTAVCVTSLGLGMGVVIAILLLLRMVFDTPPGVREDGVVELVVRPSGQLLAQAGTGMVDTWSYPDFLDVRGAASGMTITGWSRGDALLQLAGADTAVPIPAMYVSSNYFSTVGLTLPRGPGFTAADDTSPAEPEAVVSYRMWELRFRGDPNIIGRAVTINHARYVVVGVAPPGFRGHVSGLNEAQHQLWLPLSRHPRLQAGANGSDAARRARDAAWVHVFARLSGDTTVARADAIVRSAMAAIAERHPATNHEKAGGAETYFAPGVRVRSQFSFIRMVLFGLSGMVLLVVGLNISGMMLVRGAMRERELAVRLAMGASRWRLMQYHLAEAFVMAVLGGSVASAVLFGAPVLIAWGLDRWGPVVDLFVPDPWLALECVALCFVTTLVLGLLPAVRFSRPSIITALKGDSAGAGRRVGRLQRFTAAAQAGLAVPFLVICGLQFDQARVTAFADVGFQPRGLYGARVNLASVAASGSDQQLFLRLALEHLAHAPGVASASVGDGVPLDFVYRNARVAPASAGPGAGATPFVTAHTTRVGAGYLQTLGTRLLAGRTIEVTDREGAEPVVVLSEPLAVQLFPAGDPLGQRIEVTSPGSEARTYTVVGITADLVSTQMGNPRPQLFVSLAQNPASAVLLIARGAPSDPAMRGAFENAIADARRMLPGRTDSEGVFGDLITGEGLIENSRSDLLTSSAVGGAAAAVALVLAALGVYGVIAFMVATRTREIGVRVALGASRGRVLRDVLGDALQLVVPGIGVGLLLAALWVRFADPSWYPLGGVEPLVYVLAAGTASVVAVLAGIPSARRAAAVEPIVAMRAE